MYRPEDLPRCYRCLELCPPESLVLLPAPCSCEHRYCEHCRRSERLVAFLWFVASRCAVRAAA